MSTQYLQQSVSQPQPRPHEASRTTLLENDQVLVVANTYPPGTSTPIHTHRFPSVAYVVEGGTLETTTPGGAVERYDVRQGETLWSGTGHSHGARNAGSTPVRIVEIEIKHARQKAQSPQSEYRVLTPASLKWEPDSLDPRRAAALLIGDPTQPGPYTVRYRVPAGYELGLHLHLDDDEQLTVIAGAIRWSTGEAGSGAPEYVLTAGGFAMVPAGNPHRIVAEEDTILQMSGIGPHTYVYVNAADDPRARRQAL